MYKFLLAFSIFGLLSFSIALADDMDGDRVVRDEHVARAAAGADHQSAPADTKATHQRASRDDDQNLPEAEHGQELLEMQAEASGRSVPDTLELDSLGLYFGLGENFVDMANSLIDERAGYAEEHGSTPVYSRLSDSPLGDLHAQRGDSASSDTHQHQDSGDDAAEPETEGLNRRGADYDYFWD